MQAGIQFDDRDFFRRRFNAEELKDLLGDRSPRTIFNFKAATFKKSGIDEASLADEDLTRMLVEEPRYFRRPIVVVDGKMHAGTNAKKLGQELGFELA